MLDIKTAAVTTAIFGTIGFLAELLVVKLGGWDVNIETLIVFMFFDVTAGVLLSLFGKSSKTESGHFSSRVLLEGIFRKCYIIALVYVFEYLDNLFDVDFLRNGIILAFIAYEVSSLLEHAVTAGLPASLGKFKKIIENLFEIKHRK